MLASFFGSQGGALSSRLWAVAHLPSLPLDFFPNEGLKHPWVKVDQTLVPLVHVDVGLVLLCQGTARPPQDACFETVGIHTSCSRRIDEFLIGITGSMIHVHADASHGFGFVIFIVQLHHGTAEQESCVG